jgi:hypothetical protein
MRVVGKFLGREAVNVLAYAWLCGHGVPRFGRAPLLHDGPGGGPILSR